MVSYTMKTRAMLELLHQRYPPPKWASFREVNKGTGTHGGRWIDFFSLNCYPSEGYRSVACEVKAIRSDFLHEIDNPKKRQWVEKIATQCYFVTPAGLVEKDEIPDGWGLLELTAGGLRRKKVAKDRDIEIWSMPFIASILRRAADPLPNIPKALWLCLGEEIDEEALQKLVNLKAYEEVRKVKDETWRKALVDAEQRFASAKRIADVVYTELGWSASDADRLRAYLKAARDGSPELKLILQQAAVLHHQLDNLLKDAGDQK